MSPTAHRLELPRWDQKDYRGKREVWDVVHANGRAGHHRNARVNAAIRNRSIRFVREVVSTLARQARIPESEHLTVELVWVPDRRGRRDSDNLWPLLKVCCDALARGPSGRGSGAVGLDLVDDDTPEWMTKFPPRIGDPAAEPPGLRLLIVAETGRNEPSTVCRLLHQLATQPTTTTGAPR